MASVIEACPSCGVSTTIHIGQRGGDALTWSWALHCTTCGKTIEADDRGFPPPGYRRAIIEQEGLWEVVVSEGSTSSAVALALKDALEMDRATALRVAKGIPGRVWQGTAAEAEWLRRRLELRGIVATCERARSDEA